jgi:hypothetical protein
MRLHSARFLVTKDAKCVKRHQFPLIASGFYLVWAHDVSPSMANACRSLTIADRIRVFTVPSGWFNRAATSTCVCSRKNAVSTACRSSGVSTASTAALNACPRSLPSRVSSGPRSLSSSAFLVLQARVTHPDGRGEPSFNLLPWWLLW